MESSKHNWANISDTICPTMLVFGKKASWMFFVQNILTNLIISQIQFFMTSHFSTLLPTGINIVVCTFFSDNLSRISMRFTQYPRV